MSRKIKYEDYCPQDVVEVYEKNHKVSILFHYEKIKSNIIIDDILDAKGRDIKIKYNPDMPFGRRDGSGDIEYIGEIDQNWDDEAFLKTVPKKWESEMAKIVSWINPKGEKE